MDGQDLEKPIREASQQTETDKNLEQRLTNWKDERPVTRFWERKARGAIVGAMKRDLQRDRAGNPWRSESVLTSIDKSSKKLETEGNKSLPNQKDSITGESYTVNVSKTDDGWLAEEVRPDGSVISQARISQGGQTELTLHFTGTRYEGKDANPDITSDRRFPEATAQVFNLLTDVVLK